MAKKKQSELRGNTDSVKIQSNMVCNSIPSPVSVWAISEYTKTKVDAIGNVVSDGMAYNNCQESMKDIKSDLIIKSYLYINKIFL